MKDFDDNGPKDLLWLLIVPVVWGGLLLVGNIVGWIFSLGC